MWLPVNGAWERCWREHDDLFMWVYRSHPPNGADVYIRTLLSSGIQHWRHPRKGIEQHRPSDNLAMPTDYFETWPRQEAAWETITAFPRVHLARVLSVA